MNKTKGYNLLESLTALCVASVLIIIAIPSLASLKNSHTAHASAQALISSIATSRQLAVMRNQPVTLTNREGSWRKGWYMFVDTNENGIQDTHEPTIHAQNELSAQVDIYSNSPIQDYIRYLPDGRSYKRGGAFQAGTLWVCHRQLKTKGIQLVLSSSGRLRRSSGRCPE